MADRSINSSARIADYLRRAPLVPARDELGAGPLGGYGNLQYTVEQGGTPACSMAGRYWTLAGYVAGLAALRFTCPPEQVWLPRVAAARTYNFSCAMGDLLGILTYQQDDPMGRALIVGTLENMSASVENDQSRMIGWRHSLSTYMRELTDADIRALRAGILGSPSAKAAVLNQISRNRNDPSRRLASLVLSQIEVELQRRVARDSARIS